MDSSSAPDYVVAGAGVAGISAALLLARAGFRTEVWEAGPEDGGLLAPIDFQGMPLDRGSHRIHPQSDPLLRELTAEEKWEERPRRGKLVLHQRHIPYPPTPVHFLRGLGLSTSMEMGLGFLTRPGSFRRFLDWEQERKEVRDQDEGFEQFVLERVGRGAYHYFYRPYVDKVWGEAPSELSRSVAKQRVSTSKPLDTLLGFLKPKTKAPRVYLYPRQGMDGLLRALRNKAADAGVLFHYQRPITVDNLDDIDAKAIFFSGHLSDLFVQSPLQHRGLYILHIAMPSGSLTSPETDTFYLPEANYWFGRVSQPAQFSPDYRVADKEILCLEVPEGRWGTAHDFCSSPKMILHQLERAGIIHPHTALDAIQQHFIPRVYPLYRRHWYKHWQEAMQTLQEGNRVLPIGRQGLFLHCNIDHCVRISHDAVMHIKAGHSPASWVAQTNNYLDLRVRD